MIIRPACMAAMLEMGQALGKVDHLLDSYARTDSKEDWDLAGYWAGTLRARFDDLQMFCPPSKDWDLLDSPEDRLDNIIGMLHADLHWKEDFQGAVTIFKQVEENLVEWIDDMVFGQPERVVRSLDAVTQ